MSKEGSPLSKKPRLKRLKAILIPTALYGGELWSRASAVTVRQWTSHGM